MDVPSESWLDPRLVVRPSPIHRRGLFASRSITAGEVVMRLGGDLVGDAEVRRQIDRGERYDGIAIEQDVNLTIRPADWPGIHGNHSCDPNIWLAGPLELAARRPIEQDDEVVSDYATYTMAPGWSTDCSCRSGVCRGTVTGEDWRLLELQQRYAGHFAPAITRVIASGATADHRENLGP